MDRRSRQPQTGLQDAGDAAQGPGVRSGGRLSGDAPLTTESIGWPRAEEARRPLVDKLHGWVTTVDHKRLGILYVVYALFFLVVGGVEATMMRIQLIMPH